MLNELHELRTSMDAAGIQTASWHSKYKNLPHYPTLMVAVDADGAVTNARWLEAANLTSLRKWETANGHAFPAFNVKPLRQADEDLTREIKTTLRTAKKDTGSLPLATLQQWLDRASTLWGPSEAKRLDDCLHGVPSKLAALLEDLPPDCAAFPELITRAARLDAGTLADALTCLALTKMQEAPADLEIWLTSLLIATGKPKAVSLVLELADWEEVAPYPANHDHVVSAVNACLMRAGTTRATKETAKGTTGMVDAFGAPFVADGEKFPAVNLPILGPRKLRSMSGEIPAQARYGAIDAASFPAGRRTRQDFKDALEWLSSPDRRGKTWENVSRACGYSGQSRPGKKQRDYKAGLLFAYPASLQRNDEPPGLTSLFARADQDDLRESTYEVAAKPVLAALHGLVRERPTLELRLFVLVKVDKGRTKVEVTRHYTVDALLQAAQDWQEGAANIPEMFWLGGSKTQPADIVPDTPFPMEAVQCANVLWLRGGAEAQESQGLSIGEGISLLMEHGAHGQDMARRALSIALTRATPLLLAMGATLSWNAVFQNRTWRYARHGQCWPCLLGILLFKLDIRKGDYMRSVPFYIGRMLSLADQLHKVYTQEVRKAVPPQLLGNSLMRMTLDNPAKGLARLTERLMVYQGWGTTFMSDDAEKNKKVHGILAKMGETAATLSDMELPSTLDDPSRATLLLGYLARRRKQPPASDAAGTDQPTPNNPSATTNNA